MFYISVVSLPTVRQKNFTYLCWEIKDEKLCFHFFTVAKIFDICKEHICGCSEARFYKTSKILGKYNFFKHLIHKK